MLKNIIHSKRSVFFLVLVALGLLVDIAILSKRDYLHRVVALGDYDLANELIMSRCDVNKIVFGQPALQVAAQHGEIQIAELLLANGANVNDIDSIYETALHKAVKAQNLNMIELLIQHGANKKLKNIWGESATDCAKSENNIDALKILEDYN